jgi:diguanylate cyclase (GGDEF)-like protein/PAS domain S-box-containing protein
MLNALMQRATKLSAWQFLLLFIVLAEILTALMSTILSLTLWGNISSGLLLIGSIDALIVGFVVSSIGIYLIKKTTELTVINARLLQEIKARERAEEGLREIKKELEQEIIEHKSLEAELRNSEEKYRSLVESAEDSIFVLDRDYNYLFINKNHLLRLGISGNQYIGRSYSDYHSYEDTQEFTSIVDKVFETGQSIRHEHRSEQDNEYYLLTLSPVKESDSGINAVTVVSKKISELKLMEKELRDMSLTDELTGLYNRRGFLTLVEQHIRIAKRQKNEVFMLYADVDNLKTINDSFGHNKGDAVLRETAIILKETFRESDIIARVGGDEFVIIPLGTSQADADRVVARFQGNLELFNSISGNEYSLSVSYGISCFDPENPCSMEELLFQADKSMYEQKKGKKKFID